MALCSAAISHVAVGERASNDTFPWLGSTLEKGNTVGGSASSLLPRASQSTSNLLLACVPHQIVAADIAPQHWETRLSAAEGGEAAAGIVVQVGKEARLRGDNRGRRGAGREGGAAEGRRPWATWGLAAGWGGGAAEGRRPRRRGAGPGGRRARLSACAAVAASGRRRVWTPMVNPLFRVLCMRVDLHNLIPPSDPLFG
jgi:hypothetical protein